MKKIITLLLLALLSAGCNKTPKNEKPLDATYANKEEFMVAYHTWEYGNALMSYFRFTFNLDGTFIARFRAPSTWGTLEGNYIVTGQNISFNPNEMHVYGRRNNAWDFLITFNSAELLNDDQSIGLSFSYKSNWSSQNEIINSLTELQLQPQKDKL